VGRPIILPSLLFLSDDIVIFPYNSVESVAFFLSALYALFCCYAPELVVAIVTSAFS